MKRGIPFFTSLTVTMLAVLLTATMLTAQVTKGSISGSLIDDSGAVVAGAQVKATSLTTGQTYSTTTDRSGVFRFSLLPAGTYRVEISMSGFRPIVQPGVAVLSGIDSGMGALTMKVGNVSDTIEVTAGTPLVQTAESQLSDSFTGTQLYIPGTADNGGLDNLALFVPGVSASRDLGFSNTNGGTGFAVNGLRGRNNDQQIDGQNNNDNSVGGPALFIGNPEFVDQYQIATNQFKAEYGRNSGSVVNIITKSGTNNWHGAVFGSESNSALNSLSNEQKEFTTPALTKVPQYNDWFAGGTIGGPLIKDKVFVFGGLDTDRLTQNRVYTSGLQTPTPTGLQQMAACFPGSTTVAVLQNFGPYGITGGNPTPNGTPTQVAVGACSVEMAGVKRTLPTDSTTWDWLIKTDLVASSKNHITARYVYNKQTPLNGDPGSGSAAAGYPYNVPSLSQAVVLGWTRTLSSRMVNEFRVGFDRLNVEFGGNGLGNTVPQQGDIGNALARIAFTDPSLLAFGPLTNIPQGRIVNTWQAQENWSFVTGRHQIKAGGNFTYQRSPNIFLPNLNGSFTYADWNAFALNTPTTTSITLGNPNLDFREYDTFVYFGDDFKVRPDFTLNLGLTWSYYGQPANLFNDSDTKREKDASTAFFNPALPIQQRVFPRLNSPKNSWAPSIGFAYAPDWMGGKTTFRGGYRLSYDPPFYNIYLNIASSAPQVLSQTIRGVGVAPGMPGDGKGSTVRAGLAPFLTLGTADPRSFSQTTVSPNFGPDRVHSWSFGIQHELSPKAAFEIRYVGNHGERLFQSIDANPFIADLAANFPNLVNGLTPCPADQATVPNVRPDRPSPAIGRVNCNLGIVRERTNTGSSSYNGLQTEFRTNRLWNQLTMRTSYTWSTTIDNVSEIFGSFAAGGTTAFSQNPLNFRQAEFARSGLDIPHTWTLSVTEELPFFRKQNGILGHVLGGWVGSASYILSSGQPYTPVQFFLNTGAGGPDYYDTAFMGAFNSSAENARPFISNPGAPATAVGVFAGDACSILGSACDLAPTSLLDFTALNSAGTVTAVNNNQVHFIVNAPQAVSFFGTPFPRGVRNTLRTSKANYGNIQISKVFKLTERASLGWHMAMINAFNHSNYGVGDQTSIDPFVDDAGLHDFQTGFADPKVMNNSPLSLQTDRGKRQINFGLRFQW